MEKVYEFRKKRYILRYIAPLNLVDPLLDNFSPEACKTLHDILRFIHEKSVAELVDSARDGSAVLKKHAAVKLKLPIPTGIMVIDIGGGLDISADQDGVTFEQISSLPLRAIISGMMHPGVWRSDAVPLHANDFLTSMLRASDIVSDSRSFIENNVAVVSREYMNLGLRFGYHFNMIDCYCSETPRNNHIYFRFVGGATDIVKRSRRVSLIATILKGYGFNLKTKGDLVIARLANIGQGEIERILDHIGRLIAYTRQLDATMHDDSAVERYARNFLEGKY
jgi:pyruvate,water dikinase